MGAADCILLTKPPNRPIHTDPYFLQGVWVDHTNMRYACCSHEFRANKCVEIVCSRMLYEHKIIVHMDGIDANVMKIKPPLVITKEDCTQLVQALDSILSN